MLLAVVVVPLLDHCDFTCGGTAERHRRQLTLCHISDATEDELASKNACRQARRRPLPGSRALPTHPRSAARQRLSSRSSLLRDWCERPADVRRTLDGTRTRSDTTPRASERV